jgi:hypothetical protein
VTKGFPEIGGIAMNKKSICKCFITIGLLLFFTVLLPFTSYDVAIAKAANLGTDKEKAESYTIVKSVTLVKGKSYTLSVFNLGEKAKLSFKSNDSEVASVSNDGTITANNVGNAVVTVTIKDGGTKTTLTCDVIVGPPAISVKWTKERVILGLNSEVILKVIIKPDNSPEGATFFSNDEAIASVSSGGRINAKKVGMTYVFAEITPNADGTRRYTACAVYVTGPTDASALENYLNQPEFGRVASSELNKALSDFFSSGSAAAAVSPDGTSTLISDLDKYLDSKLKLTEIRAKIKAEAEAAIQKTAPTATPTPSAGTTTNTTTSNKATESNSDTQAK